MALPAGQRERTLQYEEFTVGDLADGPAGQWALAYSGSRAGRAEGVLTATTGRAAAVAGRIVATA